MLLETATHLHLDLQLPGLLTVLGLHVGPTPSQLPAVSFVTNQKLVCVCVSSGTCHGMSGCGTVIKACGDPRPPQVLGRLSPSPALVLVPLPTCSATASHAC